jgi:phosphatidylinositol-4-phosphate 3-kinase
MPLCMLPRESRLVVVLYGRTLLPPESNDSIEEPRIERVELGWTALQFFDCQG